MRELLRNINWRTHIAGLALFFGSFVLLMASLINYLDNKNSLRVARNNLLTQEALNADAHTSENILVDNLERYTDLKERGYIGETNRLQWIESFRVLANTYRLPDIQFTLESSRFAVQDEDAYWRSNIAMRVTTMKIVMRLAHEGDLYRMLNGLRANAKGLFDVEYCDLRWRDADGEENSLTRLSGVCRLKWITLVDSTSSWGSG